MRVVIAVFMLASCSVRAEILERLSWQESRHRDNVVGKAGERGRYQFTRRAWSEVMPGVPWVHAHKRVKADAAARKYVLLSSKRFKKATGRHPSDDQMLLIWRYGVSGYVGKQRQK